MATESLLVSGIIAVAYPKLTKSRVQGLKAYSDFMSTYKRKLWLSSFVLYTCSSAAGMVLFIILDGEYINNRSVFLFLVIASLIKINEQPLHHSMITLGGEKHIMYIGLASVFLVLCLSYFLIQSYGFIGIGPALLATAVFSHLSKILAERLLRFHYWQVKAVM